MENRSVISTVSISHTEQNIDKYMTLVKSLDPELYAIKIALLETRLNPDLIPKVIRSVSNIAYGTGYGSVKISISKRRIAQVAGNESELVDEPAILIEE